MINLAVKINYNTEKKIRVKRTTKITPENLGLTSSSSEQFNSLSKRFKDFVRNSDVTPDTYSEWVHSWRIEYNVLSKAITYLKCSPDYGYNHYTTRWFRDQAYIMMNMRMEYKEEYKKSKGV